MSNMYPFYYKNKSGTAVYKIQQPNQFILVRLHHIEGETLNIGVEGMTGESAFRIIEMIKKDAAFEITDKSQFNSLLSASKTKIEKMYNKVTNLK